MGRCCARAWRLSTRWPTYCDCSNVGIDLGLPEIDGWTLDHPCVLEQNELAERCAHVAVELVATRVRRDIWPMRGRFAQTIRFLGSADGAALAVKLLTQDCEEHTSISSIERRVAKRLAARSIFHLVPVQQAVACVEEEHRQVSGRVRALCECKRQSLFGIPLVEDGFQRF